VAAAPVDRTAALALARRARRFVIKVGADVMRVDRTGARFSDDDAARYLVHDDGFLRVPVLMLGDTLVRGYTDELYHDVLDGAAPTP
jgi:hypothetical protein